MFNFVPVYADFAEGVIVGAGAIASAALVYANRGRIASLFKRAEATVAAGVGHEITAIRQGLVNLENKASAAYASASSAITNVHSMAQADVKTIRGEIAGHVQALHDRIAKLESAVFGVDDVQAKITPADPAPSVADLTGSIAPAAPAAPAQAQ